MQIGVIMKILTPPAPTQSRSFSSSSLADFSLMMVFSSIRSSDSVQALFSRSLNGEEDWWTYLIAREACDLLVTSGGRSSCQLQHGPVVVSDTSASIPTCYLTAWHGMKKKLIRWWGIQP
ncbi:hypothetical protein Ancab_038039 [Ancistrocladus abbreviatus]